MIIVCFKVSLWVYFFVCGKVGFIVKFLNKDNFIYGIFFYYLVVNEYYIIRLKVVSLEYIFLYILFLKINRILKKIKIVKS